MVGVPVLDHCQDYNLVGNGVVHEGYWSTLLGLPGWPAAGEEAIVMREHFARGTLRSSHSLPAHHDSRQCALAARSAGARRKNQRRSLSASHRADRRSDSKFRHELQNESAAALAERCRCAAGRNRRWHACRSCVPITRRTQISKRKWSSMPRHLGSLDWKPSWAFSSICSCTNTQDRHRPLDRDVHGRAGALVEARCGHAVARRAAPMSR